MYSEGAAAESLQVGQGTTSKTTLKPPGKSRYTVSQGNYSIRKIQTETGTRVAFGRRDQSDENILLSDFNHSFEWDVQMTDDGYMSAFFLNYSLIHYSPVSLDCW